MAFLRTQDLQLQTLAPLLIRAKLECVFMLYILAGLNGISQAVGSQNGLVFFLNIILCSSACTLWAMIDTRLAGKCMLRIKQEVFFFSWPVATLVYLIKTRKWYGLGLWLLNVLALYATLFLTFYSTWFLIGWVRA
jgi:hypothetical protein